MKNIFGKRLKSLRKEKDLSIRQLAKLVNIDATCISRWEREITIVNAEQLIIFAKFFNVSTDYLLGLRDYD